MVRAVVVAAEGAADHSTSHTRRTRLDLTAAADTHNLQIHRPQALGVQGPEAHQIRCETAREAYGG
jgi:hypothetical protein